MKLICKSSAGWVYLVKGKLYKISFYADCELDKTFGLEYLSVSLTKLEPEICLFNEFKSFGKRDYDKNYRKLKNECINILKKIEGD